MNATDVSLLIVKGLLPYHGLGSGIKQAIEIWPDISFTDDHDGCLFTATVHLKPVAELLLADGSADGSAKMLVKLGKASENRQEGVGENRRLRRRKLPPS